MTKVITPPPIHNLKPKGESSTSKTINKIVLGALIVIGIGIALMLNWAIQSEKVLTVNQDPLPARTIRDHPTAGGIVFLTTDYCKSTNAVGDMRVSFVSDTREILLPISKERSDKGCHDSEIPVLIPQEIVPGTYKVKLSIVYDINPLKQNIRQEFNSEPIIIDPVTEDNQLDRTE